MVYFYYYTFITCNCKVLKLCQIYNRYVISSVHTDSQRGNAGPCFSIEFNVKISKCDSWILFRIQYFHHSEGIKKVILEQKYCLILSTQPLFISVHILYSIEVHCLLFCKKVQFPLRMKVVELGTI